MSDQLEVNVNERGGIILSQEEGQVYLNADEVNWLIQTLEQVAGLLPGTTATYKLTITEPDPQFSIEFIHQGYWLCKRGVYDESSVLAGQDYCQLMANYETLEKAQEENPGVPVQEYWNPNQRDLPTSAPSWFDRDAAGEAWGEDDY